MTREQLLSLMDSLMAAAQRVLTIVQKATELPRNKSIEIAIEIMQNKDKAKAFIRENVQMFAS